MATNHSDRNRAKNSISSVSRTQQVKSFFMSETAEDKTQLSVFDECNKRPMEIFFIIFMLVITRKLADPRSAGVTGASGSCPVSERLPRTNQ